MTRPVKYGLSITLALLVAAALYCLLVGTKLSACIDYVDRPGKCQTIVCRGWAYMGKEELECFGRIKYINDSGQR